MPSKLFTRFILKDTYDKLKAAGVTVDELSAFMKDYPKRMKRIEFIKAADLLLATRNTKPATCMKSSFLTVTDPNSPTMAGLFAGIGGFELAATVAGIRPVWSNEIDPYCCNVLRKNFKHQIIEKDIREIGAHNLAPVNLITGGFPCQPFSVAGKRKGKDDHRFLWPETRRVYKELKPHGLLLENVAGLFTILEPASLSQVERKEIQLFSEDPDYAINNVIERVQRRVIATIIEEIRADGYVLPETTEGTPIIYCIPACAVNAPHRRDRIWIAAHAIGDGYECGQPGNNRQAKGEGQTNRKERQRLRANTFGTMPAGVAANAQHHGQTTTQIRQSVGKEKNSSTSGKKASGKLERLRGEEHGLDTNTNFAGLQQFQSATITDAQRSPSGFFITQWDNWPTQPPVRNGNDGLPTRLVRSALKAGGNAIVPQVALPFMRLFKELLTPLTLS